MSTFGEYVAGKTIAVVGPAPAPYDQSAEVDAHDLVYRTSYGFTTPADHRLAKSSHAEVGSDWYVPGVFPAGYGTRVNMAFYNGHATRMGMRGELDQVLAELDWAMFKMDGMQASGLTNVRTVNRPPMKLSGAELQMTAMLWDLTFYEPVKVTVYGADFYTGKFEEWYDESVIPPDVMSNPNHMTESARSILWHDMADNRRVCRLVRDVGWLAGDQRFLKALDMEPAEWNPILEEQLTRAHQATLV
jgi:hypothetical protein